MNRKELLWQTRLLLTKAGFYCSEICNIRPSSFDFVARRDNILFIIKVLNNIDSISHDAATELISVAKYLNGIPLVVGKRTCSSMLEEDIVYFRYGIPIITYETLENYLHGVPPVVGAAPGGYYVNIDGEKLKKFRISKGISLGQIARVAGVSRRTIRMYEEGERATIEVAEKIAEYFGEDFIKPIEIETRIEQEIMRIKSIENEIFRRLEEIGAFIFPTKRCPFHAITEMLDERMLVGINERRIKEKAKLIASLSKVVEKHSVLFMDANKKNIEGIPVINKRELKKIDSPEKIMELIIERE
ncbi:MAG: transcriptional regulator [Thermoplasmata archaeon]|nr:transcriptional regulator [Thermoplasmata archaeon]